jgi:GNAT superfamily N-acetyltransferase
MNGVEFPGGFRLETLSRKHFRRSFRCGEGAVDDWLRTKALQHQEKYLSMTRVLLDSIGSVCGFYTLATGQVDFGGLPPDLTRKLPRRALPVAVVAWLGVGVECQDRGLGSRLLAQALRDCRCAGQTFAFVAVILDCASEAAKAFYRHWDFAEVPGHPFRLFLSAVRLKALMADSTAGDAASDQGS